MKLRNTLLAFFLLCFLGVQAQDTLTVMQYNLLEYGNYNSSWASCYESNNNTQTKDECLRIILDHVKPDILTVNEFGASQAILDDFMRHNLNVNGINYWKSDNIVNYANSNIINHIFYDSRKMELKRRAVIRTLVRDIDAYELYFKTEGLAAGDTIKLVCIVAHLKAGDGNNNESSRRSMLQNAMDFIDENYPNDNVLIMGDFNMYSSSESGYRLLTENYSNHDILFVDPLFLVGGVGYWHNRSQFAPYHTQATASGSSNPCRSGGGMDDRFDMILMSDEIYMGFNSLRYVNNSYHAVGNDGHHFNMSVDQGTNTAVPAEVAEALFDGSDHLPVTMKIAVDVHLGVEDNEAQSLYASVAPNPATDKAVVHFFNPAEGDVQFEVYSLQGQLVQRTAGVFGEGLRQSELDLQDLPKGFYLLNIKHQNGLRQIVKVLID